MNAGETVELREWESAWLPGVQLGPADGALAGRLTGAGRAEFIERRDGLQIRAKAWAGVVRFTSLQLRIVPKLAGGGGAVAKMIDYAAGLDALDRRRATREVDLEGLDLFELLALLLGEAAMDVARQGLLTDYRELEDDLPVLRGRLRAREQALRHFGRTDRLACRYDDRTADLPENRLVLAAILRCVGRVRHPTVAAVLRRARQPFAEACQAAKVDAGDATRKIVYGRRNARYAACHTFAHAVLDGVAFGDLFGGGGSRCFAFLVDMNRLFEAFVTRLVRDALAPVGLRVQAQRRDRSIIVDADTSFPYASVIPDLLVTSAAENRRATHLPVDAKYKLYDDRSAANADVYQALLYAQAYGDPLAPPPAAAWLIYPTAREVDLPDVRRLHVRPAGGLGRPLAELSLIGLPLARLLGACGGPSACPAARYLAAEAAAARRVTFVATPV